MKKLSIAAVAVLSLVAMFFVGRYTINKTFKSFKEDVADRCQRAKNAVTGWFKSERKPEAAV